MGKFFTWVIIIAVVGIVAYGGWSMYNTLNPQIVQAAGTTLQTVKLSNGNISEQVTAVGQLRSNQSAQITWNESGTVGAMKVGIGSQVKAGDVLANLEPVEALRSE